MSIHGCIAPAPMGAGPFLESSQAWHKNAEIEGDLYGISWDLFCQLCADTSWDVRRKIAKTLSNLYLLDNCIYKYRERESENNINTMQYTYTSVYIYRYLKLPCCVFGGGRWLRHPPQIPPSRNVGGGLRPSSPYTPCEFYEKLHLSDPLKREGKLRFERGCMFPRASQTYATYMKMSCHSFLLATYPKDMVTWSHVHCVTTRPRHHQAETDPMPFSESQPTTLAQDVSRMIQFHKPPGGPKGTADSRAAENPKPTEGPNGATGLIAAEPNQKSGAERKILN